MLASLFGRWNSLQQKWFREPRAEDFQALGLCLALTLIEPTCGIYHARRRTSAHLSSTRVENSRFRWLGLVARRLLKGHPHEASDIDGCPDSVLASDRVRWEVR